MHPLTNENEMHFQGCFQELVHLGSHQDSYFIPKWKATLAKILNVFLL